MNLPANFPLKKVIITVVSVVIVIALIITGVAVAVNGKAANATVDVEQVSNISTARSAIALSNSGAATSTRRSVFLVMKSALEMYTLRRSSLPNM